MRYGTRKNGSLVVGVALWAAISVTGVQAYSTIGHGAATCATWLDDQREAEVSKFTANAWLAGYLSGYSRYTSDLIDVIDRLEPQARENWVNAYCRNHPLDSVHEAADQLILELKRRASRR
jgi:hypothetical protein